MVGFYGGAPLEYQAINDQGTEAVPASTGEVLGSAFGQGLAGNLLTRGLRSQGRFTAETGLLGVDDFGRPIMGEPEPLIDPETANAQYGIKGALSFDKPVPQSVASDLYEHKRDEITREDAIARREGGLLTGGAARFTAAAAAGLLDPINLAAGFIPFVGEERAASLLGRAAIETMGAGERAGVRALTGAGQGAASIAALQPLEFGLSRGEREDYTMADALRNIALGGLLGGGLHAVGGAVADRATGRYANPLAQQIEDAGPQAREALLQGALGQTIEGKPVDVAPALDVLRPDRLTGTLGTPVESMPTHRVAASGGQSVEVAPVVVEARDLRTSADPGYDPALQPRDRDRAAATQQVREMAARLDPERLGVSSEADRGAPIVGSDGMVESGNGRLMAVRQAYTDGGAPAARYRAWLESQGVDVSRYDEPVLVRERITEMTPAERQNFAIAANRPATLALSASERAMADARAIAPEMFDLIRNPDDLAAAANRDFVRAFAGRLPQAEQGMLATADGSLSVEGLSRIRAALLAKAYGGSADGAAILARVAESIHDDVKSISNALVAAAPTWARLRASIEAGRVRADVDLTRELLDAVRRTADLRAKGTKLADALAQQDAFDRLPKPVADWMRMFYDPSGRRAAASARIIDGLKAYAAEAEKVSAERGLDLGLPAVGAGDIQRFAIERASGSDPGLLFGGGSSDGARAATSGPEIRGSSTGRVGAGTGRPGNNGSRPGQSDTRSAALIDEAIASSRREPPDVAPARADADAVMARPSDELQAIHQQIADLERESMAAGAEPGPAAAGQAEQPVGFTTAKGSTYVLHDDGTTTRNKSIHPEHDATDVGIKERSVKTVYVDAKVATNLSGAGQTEHGGKGFRLVLKDGKASLLTWNKARERWGRSPSSADIPFKTEPEVGLSPVEAWRPATDVPGYEAYRGQHAGNAITEIRRNGTAAKPQPTEADLAIAAGESRAAAVERAAFCISKGFA